MTNINIVRLTIVAVFAIFCYLNTLFSGFVCDITGLPGFLVWVWLVLSIPSLALQATIWGVKLRGYLNRKEEEKVWKGTTEVCEWVNEKNYGIMANTMRFVRNKWASINN